MHLEIMVGKVCSLGDQEAVWTLLVVSPDIQFVHLVLGLEQKKGTVTSWH